MLVFIIGWTAPKIKNKAHTDKSKLREVNKMKNKVTVTIAQREYTLISDEGEAYVEKVASYVNGQIQETMRTSGVSAVDGAVLAAANIADSYFKEMEASERLRRQLKEALDEAAQIKADLSEAKREIFRLSSKK